METIGKGSRELSTMKTKHYEFTETEMYTIREALSDYWCKMQSIKPNSPIAIEMKKSSQALLEQFKTDTALI